MVGAAPTRCQMVGSHARIIMSPARSIGGTLRGSEGRRFTIARACLVLGALALALGCCVLFALTVGSTTVGPLDMLAPSPSAREAATILLGVRLPRVLLAAAVGAALSAAGVCFQAVL